MGAAKHLRGLCLCIAFFGLAAGCETLSQPTGEANGYLVTAAKSGRNAALSQMAGEFRIVAANLLWDKVVDHYHHQFMADGGDWAKNESLLPLLKTITELDPHFTQAYELMGGTILPRTGHLAEGEKILLEGLKNNPNDWEMYREIAILYAWTEHDSARALPYAEAGLAQTNDDFGRNMMEKFCRTLEERVQQEKAVKAKGDANPLPSPAAEGFSASSRPSGSS